MAAVTSGKNALYYVVTIYYEVLQWTRSGRYLTFFFLFEVIILLKMISVS